LRSICNRARELQLAELDQAEERADVQHRESQLSKRIGRNDAREHEVFWTFDTAVLATGAVAAEPKQQIAVADRAVLPDISNTEDLWSSPMAGQDPEDPDDNGAEGEPASGSYLLREPGRRRENTELVAAVFEGAGNPKFQDVRLKPAMTRNCPGPTYREIAMQRAKRGYSAITW
jgi:hypothetical protein